MTSSQAPSADVQATIDRWLQAEREVRARLAAPGRIPVEEIGRTSGLEFLQRIGRGELPSTPIAGAMGFVPVECEHGRMVFQGTPTAEFYNPIGTVHGGYVATLLDSAVACAVQSMLQPGHAYTTLELKVNFVRALTDGVGPVRAEGRVINLSRQVGIADGRLYDAAGRLYAHATTTCLVFPVPPAAGR